MTYALLVSLILTNLAWIAYLHFSVGKERQTLLDRIEAPGEVPMQRSIENEKNPEAVTMDDDEDFWAAKEEAVT